ncbi:hypothetical protein TNCV_3374711 [Trichonephila clavipes]|nr:hypothetical protein TNCV_3374711 [Trichonephila clavipes]
MVIVYIQPQLWKTKIFYSLFKAKDIIDTDFEDENEMNNAIRFPASSEMNIMVRFNTPTRATREVELVLFGSNRDYYSAIGISYTSRGGLRSRRLT